MLEFDGLTRRFGDVVALDGLSFTVPTGQVFGFLGPNGAGKTTAMRAVFELIALDAGVVRWRGVPVTSNDRRRFGYMPEERGLYPGMVVVEQIEYLARLHGVGAGHARTAALHWLDKLGVADRATSKLEALSLGNQQRVAAGCRPGPRARAPRARRAPVGSRPVGIDAVSGVLVDEAAAGRGVLFSSHQIDLVEDLCQSVAIIDHGRLVAAGTVEELTTGGRRRLVVKVEGDFAGAWARGVPGVSVSRIEGGAVRLRLDEDTDPQAVLGAAMNAGAVEQFGFERQRLSEVFREALA